MSPCISPVVKVHTMNASDYKWRIRKNPSKDLTRPRIAHLLMTDTKGYINSACQVGPKGYPDDNYMDIKGTDRRCKPCADIEKAWAARDPVKVGFVFWKQGDGDSVIKIVDEDLWNQIDNLPDVEGNDAVWDYGETIMWLVSPDAERLPDVPFAQPLRLGKVLFESHMQDYVREDWGKFSQPIIVLGAITLPNH